MNLETCLRTLRERLRLVLACLVAGGLLGGGLALSSSPQYSSTVQLFVSTGSRADVTQQYQGSLFTQQRVKSYAAIATSPLVLQAVIDELGLVEDVASLRDRVSASAPMDTVLISVVVRDADPAGAQRVAAAVGAQFSRLISDVERPESGGSSPVRISVVQPAEVPAVPVSQPWTVLVLLGLAVGAGAGAGLALLLRTLDTRVTTPEGVQAALRAPVLGTVAKDPDADRRPLVVQDAGWSPRAESYRQLRTAVRFLGVDRTLRSFVVTSASPGEGKTTTTANLALALAQSGQSVVLVDADLRRPRLTEVLGLDPTVGLTSVLMGEVPLSEALQRHDRLPLAQLASGPVPPNPSEMLGSASLQDLLAQLTAEFDVVVFDTPPLLPVTDAAVLATLTDGAIIVSHAGRTRRDQLRTAGELLQRSGADVLGVILNAVPRRHGAYGAYVGDYDTHRTDRHELPPEQAPVQEADPRGADAVAEPQGADAGSGQPELVSP